MAQPSTPTEGEEQALESHEVIELQTFSERKAWIEEKIEVNLNLVCVLQVTHPYLVSRENASNRGFCWFGCYPSFCGGSSWFAYAE
jgi:hypothetical protein